MSEGRAGLGLPAHHNRNGRRLFGQRHIFDEEAEELFAFGRSRGWRVPDERNVLREGKDLGTFFGIHYQ